MARLVQGKGVDDLVTAVARTGRDNFRLHVAGDGPERLGLEALATRLGVDSRTRFGGWVDDAAPFWRSCDVAVVPSRWPESFGLTAVEAMASGLPVIATKSGALDELVVDAATGLTVPSGDPDAIAAALRRYAADPGLAAAHGAAGRRRCEERFDIRRCADSYRALF